MTRQGEYSSDKRREPALSLLAGPIAWLACFAIVYLITGTGCTLDYAHTNISGVNTLRLLASSAALVAAILAAWSAFTAMQKRRSLQRTVVTVSELPMRQRQEFVHFAGFILSLISLVGILWLGATVILNPIC